ncbi:ATP-dependent zinc protease family protein [Litoribrevibacter albus]|uniref:ATP-dependent Zn protease n=1 Tax=Litoribrevibacter albus TaxID=1473156 RepID=A0AA37SDR8_9GAMM|nr:ATP-dependent zinc protease [Litoribrevibacter albus]GLQ33185.1 ATP-dependent Zn protease [Litoribrevibacter albus]
MVNKSLSVLLLVGVLAGCDALPTQPSEGNPQAQNCPPPKEVQQACPDVKPTVITKEVEKRVEVLPARFQSIEKKTVIGQVENTKITPSEWSFESRIDSGATTTSIDARDITPFERDGKDWVRFNLYDRKTKQTFEIEKPVERVVKIKRHGTELQERYVVLLDLSIGNLTERVEVSLTDRSEFTYPVLIGRNFLMDRAVIDVSQKFIANETK